MPACSRSVRLVLPLLLLAAPLRAQTAPPAGYTLTDVMGPGPETTFGIAAISDTGFVCGMTLDPAGDWLGFRWSPGSPGSPSQFSRLDPPARGWGAHTPEDVNDGGVVVGTFAPPGVSLQSLGFRWKDGVCEELFAPTGESAAPSAINDAGWIVGVGGYGGCCGLPTSCRRCSRS